MVLAIAAGAVWWGGWGGISAKHPSLAGQKLAPNIPVRDFFANTSSKWDYRPSPKGHWLSWKEVEGSGNVIKIQKADGSGDIQTIPLVQGGRYFWDFDDQHLLISQIKNRRLSLWKVNAANPASKWQDITPRGFRSWRIIYRPQSADSRWLISTSDRNAKLVDIYSVEPDGLGKKLVEKNPGDVITYVVDNTGFVYLRTLKKDGGAFFLEHRKKDDSESWQPVLDYTVFDHFRVVTYPENGKIIAASNRGRDQIALVRVNLSSGEEELILHDEQKSIRRTYQLSYWPKKVDLVNIGYGIPQYRAITDRGKMLLKALDGLKKPFEFNILGRSIDTDIVTLSVSEQENSWQYWLVDLKAATRRKLGAFDFSRHAEYLADTKFFKIEARDGLKVPVLLTLPHGVTPKKLPMIVYVHGGPALSDGWGYNHVKQFMANRGYAVLSVNYRGSTGFGKKFQSAGYHQYGRAMQDDIIDATKWAVSEGIADPKKIAIYGASFGGYSAMMGVARDPDFFAAGISVVGATDIEYQTVNAPHFWGLGTEYWTRYFGSAESAADLEEMRKYSPVNLIENIKVPVFIAHGINDRVVDRAQSETFERNLKKLGKDFEAYYYEKEGHGFYRWQTKIMYYRKLENFLARQLGGRDGGFDYIELAAKYLN